MELVIVPIAAGMLKYTPEYGIAVIEEALIEELVNVPVTLAFPTLSESSCKVTSSIVPLEYMFPSVVIEAALSTSPTITLASKFAVVPIRVPLIVAPLVMFK